MKKYFLYLIFVPLFGCVMGQVPPLLRALYHIQNGNLTQLDPILVEHASLLKQSFPILLHEAIACDQSLILCNLLYRTKTDDYFINNLLCLAIAYRSPFSVRAIINNENWFKKVNQKKQLLHLARFFTDHCQIKECARKGDLVVNLLQNVCGPTAKL